MGHLYIVSFPIKSSDLPDDLFFDLHRQMENKYNDKQ